MSKMKEKEYGEAVERGLVILHGMVSRAMQTEQGKLDQDKQEYKDVHAALQYIEYQISIFEAKRDFKE